MIQHRFQSKGEINGHAVGNLLIVALWEQLGDPVQALDLVGGCSAPRAGCCPCPPYPWSSRPW